MMNNKDITKENLVMFSEKDWLEYLNWFKNQIFKLLPLREENGKWEGYIDSLITELRGICEFIQNIVPFMSLMFKLSALGEMAEFRVYRKTIFECINLVDKIKIGDKCQTT